MSELAAIDQAAIELEARLAQAELEATHYMETAGSDDPERDFADWFSVTLATKRAKLDDAAARRKAILALVEKQFGYETKAIGRDVDELWFHFGDRVNAQCDKDLAEQNRHGKPKRSVNYAGGKVGYCTKGGEPTVEVDNEAVAMAHAAKACPEAIQTKRTLSRAILKDHLRATGEILPGTHKEEPAKVNVFYVGKFVRQSHLLPTQEPSDGE